MIYTPGYDPVHQIWDRERRTARENFVRKRKSTVFIYLTGSKICEAKGHLSMSSCLQDDVINYAPSIGKYINK